ncbi:hypothetical protein QL285_042140 [Trifolium repens]|nr:hypothetical protein QL285_042140 [Trifolium repens]
MAIIIAALTTLPPCRCAIVHLRLCYRLFFYVSSSSSFQAPFLTIPGYPFLIVMAVKPTVAFRAILVGGIAAFAKIAGAMKAAGGVKMGAAAAAMTAAATAAMTGSKQEQTDASQQPSK